ncbi:hypothetical protein N8344_01505 [bacterium]|nr:hypothetical protein [bacterium]
MSSESEYERLYQLWVQQNTINGGTVTLDGANTPAQYYDEASSLTLTPQQLAELQARQAHYNRTQALQTISSEIGANNFTNPYNKRSVASINKLNAFSSSQGVSNAIDLSKILNGSDVLAFGGSAVVIAALSNALGVDFEKLLKTAGLAGIGIAMFNSLQSHTNSQTVNLPETLENASQLAGMNAQFGEGPSSCSLFNELMGILAGAFDGAFDFIDAAMDKVSDMINQVAGVLGDIVAGIKGAIAGALGDIVAGIKGAIAGGIDAMISAISGLIPQGIKDLFNEIGDIVSGLKDAFSDIANQITSEIANALEMANQIAQKLAALAMAAAMLDPCKLAVLMNTGSPDLKAAANSMIAPVTNIIEEVQTELDSRANPEEVTRAVENAKAEAQTAPGVPQSPFSEAAKIYTGHDAYLHSDSGGNLLKVTPSMFGTEEKFQSTPTETGSTVTKLPETGSDSDAGEEQEVETPKQDFWESKAYATWKQLYFTDTMSAKAQHKRLVNKFKRTLQNGKFRDPSVKIEIQNLYDLHLDIKEEISRWLDTTKKAMSYKSSTGKREQAKEDKALQAYNLVYDNRTSSSINSWEREYNQSRETYKSLKSQIIE